jgi:hypothetical protein
LIPALPSPRPSPGGRGSEEGVSAANGESERDRAIAVIPARKPSAQPDVRVARVPSVSSAKNVATAAPSTAPSVFEP